VSLGCRLGPEKSMPAAERSAGIRASLSVARFLELLQAVASHCKQKLGGNLPPYRTGSLDKSTAMAVFLRHSSLRAGLPRELLAACAASLSSRSFSVLNRPPPNYEGHVPLTRVEKAGLAMGSAVMSLLNPRRGGTVHSRSYSIRR
jgi:hypothetical protein